MTTISLSAATDLSSAPPGTMVGQLQKFSWYLVHPDTGDIMATPEVLHIWDGTSWVDYNSDRGIQVRNELHANIPPVKPLP